MCTAADALPPFFPTVLLAFFIRVCMLLWWRLQVLTECRVFKTPAELAVMQYACSVASAAHVAVMQVGAPLLPAALLGPMGSQPGAVASSCPAAAAACLAAATAREAACCCSSQQWWAERARGVLVYFACRRESSRACLSSKPRACTSTRCTARAAAARTTLPYLPAAPMQVRGLRRWLHAHTALHTA
jgi:hypothetical protein